MAHNIDLSKLNAEQLDQLIADAGRRRANMDPPIPLEHLNTAEAIVAPSWYTEAVDIGALFQIRHPGFGWLAFVLTHAERSHLLSVWLHQSLTFNPVAKKTGRTDPAEGGFH